MSPQLKFRQFKKEYALQLLEVAEGDLESAQALYKLKVKRRENIFFMAQQCIEKCLKAVLCANGHKIPMTHDLGEIMLIFPNTIKLPFGPELNELTEFATTQRYMVGMVVLSDSDADEVLKRTEDVLAWAKAEAKK